MKNGNVVFKKGSDNFLPVRSVVEYWQEVITLSEINI